MLNRLLFHIAPDLYNRNLALLQKDTLAPSLIRVWEEALRLPGTSSFEDSFLAELQEYFGISREEALARMNAGAETFAAYFARLSPDLRDGVALERIYDDTDLEVFELAEWHARRFHDGPINYVLALQAARASSLRRYLDYGSGIGSGAILFARHGFDVTLADVSSPMLAFARWRLARRGLPHRAVHLRTEPLDGGPFDVIALLDVLEHVADPVGLVASLRQHLTEERGLMVIRAPFDEPRPQHIPHDLRTPSRFSALGFRYAWELMGTAGLSIVLRRTERGHFANSLAGLLDDRIMGAASKVLGAARALRLRFLERGGTIPEGAHTKLPSAGPPRGRCDEGDGLNPDARRTMQPGLVRHGFTRKAAMRVVLALTRSTRLRGRRRIAFLLNSLIMPADGYVLSALPGTLLMELDLTDRLQRELHYLGEYEREEINFILSALPPDGVFVDAGANIGWHTLRASRHLREGGKVYAFEPFPPNLLRLRRNLDLNGVTNVVVESFALSDKEETAHIAALDVRSGNATLAYREAPTQKFNVSCVRLDEYAKKHGIEKIAVIKMDVEGSELRVLRGMNGILQGPHPPLLLCEINPIMLRLTGTSPEEVFGYLEERGYTPHHIGEGGCLLPFRTFPPEEGLENYAFVHRG